MGKRVLTVLRSGGEYGPQHVQAIQRQVRKWASSDTEFFCVSDVPIPGVRNRLPLRHDWPGWWAKVELFRPDIPDDFLYTDLDNVILGPIDFALETNEFTADIGFSFFRKTPDPLLEGVYEGFCQGPFSHMEEWDPANRSDNQFGDAAFFRSRCGLDPAKWPSPEVMNIVDVSPPCPWRVPGVILKEGIRVLLCGGKRRRPWVHLSQMVQKAYWCR